MKKIKQEDLIQDIAREANLLKDFVTIMKSFSDFLYFNVVFSEILSLRFNQLSKYSKIESQNFTIIDNAFHNVQNSLSNWVNQNTNQLTFKSKGELTSSFISKFTVKNKSKLLKFLTESEHKLTEEHKLAVLGLIHRVQESSIINKLLNLSGKSTENIRNLLAGYANTTIYKDPSLVLTLDERAVSVLAELKENPFHTKYNIQDPEIQNGIKKQVAINIYDANNNTYINYLASLYSALKNRDRQEFERAKEYIRTMQHFYTNTDDLPLPTETKRVFDKSFNFHSLLENFNVAQTAAQGNLLMMSIPGDVMARKFFIFFNSDYSYYSTVLNMARAREYQQAPAAFTFKYASERLDSERMKGLKLLLTMIDDLEKDIVLSDKINKLQEKLKVSTKDAGEAAVVMAVTYMASRAFEAEEPVQQAMTVGIIDYVKTLVKKSNLIETVIK